MKNVWICGLTEGLIRGICASLIVDFVGSVYSFQAAWAVFALAAALGLACAATSYFLGRKWKRFAERYYLISFAAFLLTAFVILASGFKIFPRREVWYGEAFQAVCALFLFVGISEGIRIGILAKYTRKDAEIADGLREP